MSTTAYNILFESASGYGIFSVLENEEIAGLLEEVQKGRTTCLDFSAW